MSTNEVKSKEQIEKENKENEIARLVKSREEAGLCACTEICVAKELGLKEAKKDIKEKDKKAKKDHSGTDPCNCEKICIDAALGASSSYVRELSKPPYTNWSGTLTCPATSIYADSLTEFKPQVVKEGDDKEIKDKIIERNQKKGVRFTHAGQEMVRGWWKSPEPEFWLGRLVC
jgi:hypothetical protein